MYALRCFLLNIKVVNIDEQWLPLKKNISYIADVQYVRVRL